jgi:AraC-like DNA-binding protein
MEAAPAELVSRAPGPQLAGLVTRFIHYAERGGPTVQVEAASLDLPLVIGFADAFGVALGRPPGAGDSVASFVAGLTRGPARITSTGGALCVQVNFTPLGAFRFHGIPLRDLADRIVPLDDLAPDIRALRERLGDLTRPSDRLDLLERFVTLRIAVGPEPPPAIARAFGALRSSGGTLPVGAVAAGVGWSRQHLSARMSETLGLGPKALSRILRFGCARQMAAAGGAGWAEIAAACGYADQSHLVREFRALGGASPVRVTRDNSSRRGGTPSPS